MLFLVAMENQCFPRCKACFRVSPFCLFQPLQTALFFLSSWAMQDFATSSKCNNSQMERSLGWESLTSVETISYEIIPTYLTKPLSQPEEMLKEPFFFYCWLQVELEKQSQQIIYLMKSFLSFFAQTAPNSDSFLRYIFY